MSLRQWFGTDGIRGVAGEPPLDAASVYALGLALGDDLRERGSAASTVIVGEDTRESSGWIASTLAAGLETAGARPVSAGVLPTPGVALLTRVERAAAGVMISASHNPWRDNGIKIFGPDGYKLPDVEEAAIERSLESHLARGATPRQVDLKQRTELQEHYVDFLAACVAGSDFGRLRVVIDCANGAAGALLPRLLARLRLPATLIHCAPDGRNINAGCGALHPKTVAGEVRTLGADAGLALDGDADRAILVDASGSLVDGDTVLFVAARDLAARGALHPRVVVGTVMTNFGLELALRRDGIRLVRSAVGDRYVLEAMRQSGAQLGGEPSGHVIFADEHTTGDGLLTALRCFDLMARGGRSLAALSEGWEPVPHKVVNVAVREKPPLDSLVRVQTAIQAAEREIAATGRVLVRYSGTELLARVMVEAESATLVERQAHAIAEELRAAIGAEMKAGG